MNVGYFERQDSPDELDKLDYCTGSDFCFFCPQWDTCEYSTERGEGE